MDLSYQYRQNQPRFFNIVKDLKRQGLIDAVGMQMNFLGGENLDPNTAVDTLERGIATQLETYRQLGVDVRITELTVDTSKIKGPDEQKPQKVQAMYRMIGRVCGSSLACKGITVWGMTRGDDSSDAITFLFNNSAPRPEYYAMLTGLLDASAPAR